MRKRPWQLMLALPKMNITVAYATRFHFDKEFT
jgi:hypothetical protein